MNNIEAELVLIFIMSLVSLACCMCVAYLLVKVKEIAAQLAELNQRKDGDK